MLYFQSFSRFNSLRNALNHSKGFNSSAIRLSVRPSFAYLLKHNCIPPEERKTIEENVAKETEGWLSTGYSLTDRKHDDKMFSLQVFSTIGCLIVFLGWFTWNNPGKKLRKWASTEAFLELERREKKGLPLIDRNLIDPVKIKLPTDEELGPDFKIIL